MNYVFAGASSSIAKSCAKILQNKGHRVTGLSRNETNYPYDHLIKVNSYRLEDLPALDEAIDGLVYFPGTISIKPFQRILRKEFIEEFEVHVLGAVDFVQKYLPELRKSPVASVVFISSVAASIGLPFHTSVSASKAALEGLTRALAAELAPTVSVNCVAPSMLSTPLSERWTNTPEKQEAIKNKNPKKRIGKPEEVASMICYLLSEEAGLVTGQTLAIDGGMKHLKL